MRALLPLALLLAGCVQYVTKECPSCRVLNARSDDRRNAGKLPRIDPRTKRLFVIVPGALGYGWEWNPSIERLRATPGVEHVVFWWEPHGSIHAAARALSHSMNDLLAELEPRALEEVVIVAHSMAGIVAAYAAPALQPPAGVRMRLVTIGTAFAGMIGSDFGYTDNASSAYAVFTQFTSWRKYPAVPPELDVVEYRTTWPEDPVMEPRFGHDPAPPDVGPQPRRRVQLPHMDHNKCVDLVVERLLRGVE